MKSLYKIVALVVLASMVLSACATPTATLPPAPTNTPEPPKATNTPKPAEPTATEAPTEVPLGPVLKIGQISMLSGSMASYGAQQVEGFRLGLIYASGGKTDAEGRPIIANRPVEVITRDDEGNAEKSVQIARELIEKEGVEILQGPVSSTCAMALTPLALEYKTILMIDPAASSGMSGAGFNPYVFRTSRGSFDDAFIIMKYLLDNKIGTKVALLGVDNAFGKFAGTAINYKVPMLGGEVVKEVYAPLDTTDFTPYIQDVMNSDAEILYLVWSGVGYVQLFDQLSEMGAMDQMTVATGFGDNVSFGAVFSSAVPGTVGLSVYHYTLANTPVNDWLVEHHMADNNGVPPDLFTAGGFSSAIALAAALEKTGGDATGDAMIPALEGLTFEGPKGTYHIRPEDHVCEQPMYMAKLVNLDPDLNDDNIPEYKWFEPIYTSGTSELGIPCTLTGEYASRCGNLPVIPAP